MRVASVLWPPRSAAASCRQKIAPGANNHDRQTNTVTAPWTIGAVAAVVPQDGNIKQIAAVPASVVSALFLISSKSEFE
jgi:hypothetical protein